VYISFVTPETFQGVVLLGVVANVVNVFVFITDSGEASSKQVTCILASKTR
jgi:hypothetical protein